MLKVQWLDKGIEAQCLPNPRYPDGIDIDVSNGALRTCSRVLPYPAPRCGVWLITCDQCRRSTVVTAAGRIDDPRSIMVACK
jgi:hypothetical protein